jgi:hypothetical protein
MDWYGFTLAFKGMFLEGLEVALIVLTLGTSQGSIPLAALGAGIALVLVVIVGALVHQPLSRVPENTMKFAVGLMLATFGIFWSLRGHRLGQKYPPEGGQWQPWSSEILAQRVDRAGTRKMVIPAMANKIITVERADVSLWPAPKTASLLTSNAR